MERRMFVVFLLSVLVITVAAGGGEGATVLEDEQMSVVRGGCPTYYQLGQTCGITLKCKDSVGEMCVPILDPCRPTAYKEEYMSDWCWLGAGSIPAVVRTNCAWRYTCSCDQISTMPLLWQCKYKNEQHNQSQYDKCLP